MIRGRLGMRTDAEVVTMGQWHGVRGDAVVSCFHTAGGNAGLCEEPLLVLRDDDDNVPNLRLQPTAAVRSRGPSAGSQRSLCNSYGGSL